MNRVAVVANPTKLTDAAAVREQLAALAADHEHELLWLVTTAEDPGTGQAEEALGKQASLVCALGGDGTVRSVATALAGTGVPLGLLPGGTGNLLALNLGLPLELEAAFTTALTGAQRTIDLGWARRDDGEEEPFLVMCGMGLDAETMADTSEELKARVGWIGYGITGAAKLLDRGLHVWVRGEGVRDEAARDGRRLPLDQHVRSVLVGNCGALQGGLELLPGAKVDDGLLDLLLFAPRGPAGWAAALWGIVTRRRHGHPSLRAFSATGFTIEARHPCQTQVDGDAVGECRRLRARVEPGVLVVRVPHPEA